MTSLRRGGWLFPFLTCWLGFALRVFRLDAQPFWFDEGLTVDLALAPPLYVLQTIDRPPLYYPLMHTWVSVVGVSPFTFRFFSVWWGTLALPLFYQLGRRLLGRRAGAWALGLAALSPFYVYYAQEARTYALTLALTLASSWALLVWLDERRGRWLALHAAATLACLYTHYTALLLPLTQAAIVFLSARQEKRGARSQFVLRWLAAQAVVGTLFLPWPLYVRRNLPDLVMPGGSLSPVNPIRHVARLLWTTLIEFGAGRTLAWPVADVVGVLFLFLVVLGVMSPHLPARARRFLMLSLGLPPLALLLLPRTAVYFSPKYLIVATPAFYLLAVAGLRTLRREMRWLFLVCLLLSLLSQAWGLGDWFFRPHLKVA